MSIARYCYACGSIAVPRSVLPSGQSNRQRAPSQGGVKRLTHFIFCVHADSSAVRKARFAAALFGGCTATNVTRLTTPKAAVAAFKAMQGLDGGTNISAGLQLAASMIPRRSLNVSRVLILISDGVPSDCGETDADDVVDTVAAAEQIHQEGIYILPVGVGEGINSTLLEEMASNRRNVYTVANYTALGAALETIIGGACAATAKPCTTAKVCNSPLTIVGIRTAGHTWQAYMSMRKMNCTAAQLPTSGLLRLGNWTFVQRSE